MFYFGHGDNHDEEILQAATQHDNTLAIIVGIICLLVAFVLLSRYISLRKQK